MEATRDAGIVRLKEFIPHMGRAYAAGRNHDLGAGLHSHVSGLSPYLRRRLVLEEEVADAAIRQHGDKGAEKFIQEVIWRGYFKGWLEHRPAIWAAYRDGLARDPKGDLALIAQAEAGQTGLDCFDAWARELVTTGYLHNHARMWFASIWIFTFKLPWRLGADFFMRHLLDGDPASNTLSWRWVAGLHTRGKAYQATAWNIAQFTQNRFQPDPQDLAQHIEPLDYLEPDGLPPLQPLRAPVTPDPARPTLMMITEEDCRLEDFAHGLADLRGAIMLAASHLRSPKGVAAHVHDFERRALRDAATRLGAKATAIDARTPEGLIAAAQAVGATQIATGYVPVGPLRDWLDQVAPILAREGIVLGEWQRDWDKRIWPHATAGFFKVKKRIQDITGQPRLL